MAIMTSDEEEGTYDVSFVGGDGYDYKIGVFLKEYEDDGTKLASYVFSNDYSDRSFYLAYESLGDEDLDAFSADARNVFFTHTELKKTHFLNDLLEYLASEGTESEEGASGEGSAAEVYSGGSTYPICGWYSDETLMEITIPDGCVVDMEYSDKETLVMDKKGTYATVWVNGYPDLNVNEYLKEGKVDDIYSETYDDFSAEMLEKKTLSNGFDVYTLVMKYAIKDIDYKTTYYMVSVQKDEDTGVSLNISEEEIKELGYASVDDLIRELFGE